MPFRNAINSGITVARFGGLPPPIVTSISGIINTNTTTTITVNGSRFTPTSVAYVTGAGVSNISRAMTTTFVSVNQITFSTNAAAVNFVASAGFDIQVLNGPGSSYTYTTGAVIDPDPTWATAAGDRGSYATMGANTISHQATDPLGVTISLASGSIPAGLSLASNGNISGTVDWSTLSAAWSSTYNYTLRATDNTVGDFVDRAFSLTYTNTYFYRQVYAYGFVVGGYQGSTPHYAAHRIQVSNDSYTGLGNRLDQQAGYVDGGHGDDAIWVYGTGGGLGAYSHYSGYHMFNDTSYNNGDMGTSKDDAATASNHGGKVGVPSNYTWGGGNGTNVKHTFSNNSISYVAGNTSDNFANAWESDTYGYCAYGANRMSFSAETWSGMPSGRPQGSNQAHSKAMSTKRDFALVEDGGNGSYTYTRHNFAAETLNNNWTNKPQTCGETNFAEGQDWGYGAGCCGSTCQNNWFWKQYFTSQANQWLGGTDRAMSSGDGASRRA